MQSKNNTQADAQVREDEPNNEWGQFWTGNPATKLKKEADSTPPASNQGLEEEISKLQKEHRNLQESAKKKAQRLSELYTQREHLAECPIELWKKKSWTEKIDSKSKLLLKKVDSLYPPDQHFWPYNGELIHGPSVRRLIKLGRLEVHEKEDTVVFKSSRHNGFRFTNQYTFEVGKSELGPITKLIQDHI